MPSRLAVQKLRRHLNGLENYPMASSYPQETGETEFREIVAAVKGSQSDRRVDTNVTIQDGRHCSYFKSVLEALSNYICGTEEELETDEVDGRVEEILQPLVKLYFLKILLIDIGISLGDVVTDLAQGINLIFDHNWNIQWSTFHYGLVIISLLWLPLLPLSLHSWSTGGWRHLLPSHSKPLLLLTVTALLVFFPLVPTLMYFRILFIRRNFTTNRNKLKFLEFEDKTTELKALVGSIESPLQFILMLWLMFRGILTLPWDQPLSSSCVEDSLGRVACLPSIPMLSMLFSLLSIIKSVFDLNMFAVSSASVGSLTRSKVCQHLVLCFFPFYLCNILFRLPAYAFILCFIDIWSMIPAVILFILQLALCGLFFIRQESEDQDLPMDDLMVGSYGTINEASTDDEGRHDQVDGPPGLVWDGEQWISRSVMGNNSIKERQNSKSNMNTENLVVSGEADSKKVMPSSELINDRNTPLIINSIAGFFFPCVHTCFRYEEEPTVGQLSLQSLDQLIQWQKKVLKYEVIIFNAGTMVVLLTIFILVTFVDAFYYKNNIFDFFWFSMAMIYLIFMGVFSMVWSLWIYPDKTFQIQEKEPDKSPTVNGGNISRQKRRHLTGESNTESICSVTTSFVQDTEGPENMKMRSLFCAFMSAIVVIPAVLGIAFYKFLPANKLYVMKFDRSTDYIEANIVGVTQSFRVTEDLGFLKARRIFITNKTIVNLEESDYDLVISIDSRLEHQWRVSSPRKEIFPGLSIPVLVLRKLDLSLQKLTLDDQDLFVTTNITNLSDIIQPFSSCGKDSVIQINYDGSQRRRSILKDKYFRREDGHIMQDWRLVVLCTAGGFRCQLNPPPVISIQCEDFKQSVETKFVNWQSKSVLTKLKVVNANGRQNDFCCLNSSHAVEIFGNGEPISSGIIKSNCSYSNMYEETKDRFDGIL